MTVRNIYRKSLNNVMLTLTGVCAFATVATLFAILAYLVYNGATSVDVAFFTQLPKGTGELGGGMANAILGSAEIVAIASAIGIPVGFFTGVYLAEWGGAAFCFVVR
jgi:phosphate transport system permease protein